MSGTVTISAKLYLDLVCDSEKLRRLEAGGVDNWDWYGESLNQNDEPSLDEFEETEEKRIRNLI